ncbi:MAG: serine/threonine-protein kinase, partial [Pirellulales bacterium]
MTEGQLALATRDWTAFGTSTLAGHVVSSGLVKEAQAKEILRHADSLYERTIRTTPPPTTAGSDKQQNIVAALNPDGRVASLLGLTGSSPVISGELQDRSVGARYTLLRRLGQGGLGTVWLARDENLHRYVAVKELNAETASGDIALEHFRREAEITGRLEHPGIVPIYQFGHDEKTGRAFYAMRFLGRRTLQDAIDEYHERLEAGVEDKMMLHRLLSSFVSVCHSIGHAHTQKVIHRDLKPANVALDEFGQVTLLDWGLSKVSEETGMYDVAGRSEPGDLHDLSSAHLGRVIGTPLYMAPEQAAGRLEDVDMLTDVYGLGGVLYSILTGVGPHHASAETSDTGIGREQFLSRIVADDVAAPTDRRLAVPSELNAICMKALSRQRYCRYQSAAELADDVQRYMAGTPVHAYDAPFKRRLSRWMMRHPTLAQMLWLSGSLFLIGLVAVALTARAGRERFVAARFASAVETAHDMEVNLQFEAHALERDLHFITELPAISALTEFHEVLSKSDSAQEPNHEALSNSNEPSVDEANPTSAFLGYELQTPQQWLDRQGELFDGFLNANPSYLMMASSSLEDEHRFRELVRSERVSAGQRAVRVSKRQLRTTESTSDGNDSD